MCLISWIIIIIIILNFFNYNYERYICQIVFDALKCGWVYQFLVSKHIIEAGIDDILLKLPLKIVTIFFFFFEHLL